MADIINKLYRNHALIYKVFLFVSTIFLIVYFFPKSGKFKYDFQKGKPWQSESLQAPFDFAIKKTDEEIESEKQFIKNNSELYFNLDPTIIGNIKANYIVAFENIFADTLDVDTSTELYNIGEEVISRLYLYGVLPENRLIHVKRNMLMDIYATQIDSLKEEKK